MTGNTEAGGNRAHNLALDILAVHPTGLRSDEVRRRLASAGLCLGPDKVTDLLRKLQDGGLVTYPNRRWTLKTLPPTRPERTRPSAPQPRTRPTPEPTPAPTPATAHPSVPAATIPCLPFTANIIGTDAPDLAPAALRGTLPAGWALLRRLLPYWREGLRAEERPRTFLPLARANVEFCGLTAAGPWWPTPTRRVELRLATAPVPPALLNHLARHGNGADLFLGYPLQLLPGKDGDAFARPVFTFACGLSMHAGELRLSLPAQAPDLNAEWIERQCRDPAERRALLGWLGISGPLASDDGDDGDDDGAEYAAPDLPDLTERLAAWRTKAPAQPLAPGALTTSLPAAPTVAQLVNALVLFAAPTTRYSRRTLADLAALTNWRDEQLAQTALASLFVTDRPAPGAPDRSTIPALPPLVLNEDQFAATRAALNAPLTVITGPPGTGKSQVVAAIMASAALTGRTALLASKNHKALDAVEERLADLLPDDHQILARASRPWGTAKPIDLRAAADAVLARGASSGDRSQLTRTVDRLARTQARLSELEGQLQTHADLADVIAGTEARLEDAESALSAAQLAWAVRSAAPTLPSPPPAANDDRSLPIIGRLVHWLRAIRTRRALARLAPLDIPWNSDDHTRRLTTWRHLWDYQ